MGSLWNTCTGDLLFADRNPAEQPDGKIDHPPDGTHRDANGRPAAQKPQGRSTVTGYGQLA